MTHIKTFVFVVITVASLTMSTMVQAQRAPYNGGLSRAVQSVEQSTGGKVLSADIRRVNGQLKYRIKILTPAGRVRIIYVDAR